MQEITPDLISRIASRIYNEGMPHATDGSVQDAGTAASPGLTPAASSALGYGPLGTQPSSAISNSVAANVPRADQSPSLSGFAPGSSMTMPPTAQPPVSSLDLAPLFSQVPPAGLPSVAQPTSLLPNGFAALPFTHPTAIPTSQAAGSTPLGIDSVTSQGLKAFVSGLRGSPQSAPMPPAPTAGDGAPKLRPRLSFAVPKPTVTSAGSRPLDVMAIRKDFPILRQLVHGRPLIWMDNAATTQKPQCVIDAISRFYENDNSNIHRAAHTLAARATDAYEQARKKVQSFLGASAIEEIVFVRGTTEGINLVTQTYGRKFLQAGDEILLSVLEHHANIVPWQMVAKESGAVLRVIPVNDRGEILLEEYQRLLGPRTKVVALTHASNSLGTILPIAEMTQMAKRYGARVLIDGAQSVAHLAVNMQQLGCDFFVFSGHKIFGPSGIGAVYINRELHDILPPWQGGGNMIRNVTFEETTFSDAPAKFEAGTPNIADAVGLGAALDYVQQLGLPNIHAYEHSLAEYATERLQRIAGLRLIGTAREKVGVLSFVLSNRKTEEIGRMLDQEGIAVRSGHHCSQPSLRRFGVESTVRPSLSLYNTIGEIDRLVDAIQRIAIA